MFLFRHCFYWIVRPDHDQIKQNLETQLVQLQGHITILNEKKKTYHKIAFDHRESDIECAKLNLKLKKIVENRLKTCRDNYLKLEELLANLEDSQIVSAIVKTMSYTIKSMHRPSLREAEDLLDNMKELSSDIQEVNELLKIDETYDEEKEFQELCISADPPPLQQEVLPSSIEPSFHTLPKNFLKIPENNPIAL